MEDFLNLILEPLKELLLKFKAFAPNLLAMLVILLVGIAFRPHHQTWSCVKFLTAINFDSWSDRMGFTKLMRKGDIWAKPSATLSDNRVLAADHHYPDERPECLARFRRSTIWSRNFSAIYPRFFSAAVILIIGYVMTGFISQRAC